MARQEAPLSSFQTEAILDLALEDPVEIKDKNTGQVMIRILAARIGHPKYGQHLREITDDWLNSQQSQDEIQYPVGSDSLHSSVAEALGLPVIPLEGAELPLPVYEKLRPLGQITFTDTQKQDAINVLKAAQTVVSIKISPQLQGEAQNIILVDNGGNTHTPSQTPAHAAN